jgi:hypothetical protein
LRALTTLHGKGGGVGLPRVKKRKKSDFKSNVYLPTEKNQ